MSHAQVRVDTATAMHEFGRLLAGLLRAGDLVVLDGPLGAGKTTLARGLGEGLGVRGDVSSPTFVIARRHRGQAAGPALLHIDAYRVGSEEFADLELDIEATDCIAVVEWGRGKVDDWSADRLLITIAVESADPDCPRILTLTGIGQRWSQVPLADVAAPA
jgi:tRNA threonylcarbamoyladenosine biosynthesis protein TsaE